MHRGSRSHAVMRALRHQSLIDHSLPPGSITIRTVQPSGLKFLVQYIARRRVSTLLSPRIGSLAQRDLSPRWNEKAGSVGMR